MLNVNVNHTSKIDWIYSLKGSLRVGYDHSLATFAAQKLWMQRFRLICGSRFVEAMVDFFFGRLIYAIEILVLFLQ